MMAIQRLSSGRLVGLAVLAATGALVLPLVLHANPAATPGIAAPEQPLTVRRPDTDAETRRAANRARILEARIDALHAGLQLTSAQEPLWQPVADAIRGFAEARGIRFRQQVEAADNSIDGLKMQGDHMAKVGAAMGRLADATRPLVASLTPDQKSRLPTLLERVQPRKMMARAFGVPMDADAGGRGSGLGGPGLAGRPGGFGMAAPGAGTAVPAAPSSVQGTAAPGKAAGDAGAMSKPKDAPYDDDE